MFFENAETQQYAADAVADAQRAQLELEKVRAAVSHGEAVQRLEHDMKNLLLLIHMLNERGDSGRIDAVIDRIETEIKAEADGGIQKRNMAHAFRLRNFGLASVLRIRVRRMFTAGTENLLQTTKWNCPYPANMRSRP